MQKQYEELIVSLANDVHRKQLKYLELDRVKPEELPSEEFELFIAEHETAQAEWRRASIFLNSIKRSLLDSLGESAAASLFPYWQRYSR